MFAFFFQAEDGIRYLVRSRGLGDVYKRQVVLDARETMQSKELELFAYLDKLQINYIVVVNKICLLYTSDAADERSSVDLGGRRIIKKKKYTNIGAQHIRKLRTKSSNRSVST